MSDELSPLEKVGRPEDRPCPNCGSRETLNRLEREIKEIGERAERKKQMLLFKQQPIPAGLNPGMGGLASGALFTDHVGISVTHDVCADCGTCFDFSRLEDVGYLRAQVKKLRLENESIVDSLGRLDEG
jgi:hypothetical protein